MCVECVFFFVWKSQFSFRFVGICRKLSFVVLVDDVPVVFAYVATVVVVVVAAAAAADDDDDVDSNADEEADTVHDNNRLIAKVA